MQKIIIIGNLGADAVIQNVQNASFCSFRVGCSEKVRKNGEDAEVTTWYNCVVNNVQAGFIPYLKKGKKVYVEGRPRYSLYDSVVYRQKMIDISLFVDRVELLSPKEAETGQQQAPQNEQAEDVPF